MHTDYRRATVWGSQNQRRRCVLALAHGSSARGTCCVEICTYTVQCMCRRNDYFLFLKIYRYLRMTLKEEIVKCRDTNLRLRPSAFFVQHINCEVWAFTLDFMPLQYGKFPWQLSVHVRTLYKVYCINLPDTCTTKVREARTIGI